MNTINNIDLATALIEAIGQERLDLVQGALEEYAINGNVLDASTLVMGLVMGTENIDVPTAADAIAEIATSKKATRALIMGKMSVQRAIKAHEVRAKEAEKILDRERIMQEGVTGTETLHIDGSTNMHLVHLSRGSHLVYEGMILRHCLRNPYNATSYLENGRSRVYSLREHGILPLATIEVVPSAGTIPQARAKDDLPIHVASDEYRVLFANLDTLAQHSGAQTLFLRITDSIRTD